MRDLKEQFPDLVTGFEYKGQTYPSLPREYTYDGDYLNAMGRRVVGMILLKVLQGISEG